MRFQADFLARLRMSIFDLSSMEILFFFLFFFEEVGNFCAFVIGEPSMSVTSIAGAKESSILLVLIMELVVSIDILFLSSLFTL